MEKNYDFRKGILSCTDRNVSSTDSAASKRAGFFSWFTKVLPLFALLFCATGSAQTPIEFSNFPLDLYGWKYALEWEPVTNCSRIVIRDGEEIVQSNCIIACKGSTVEYFIRDIFVDLYGIQDVAWDVTGGIIEETYDDSDLPKEQFGVKIQWDEDAPGGYIKMTIYTDIYPYVREVLVCVLFINSPEALFEPDGGNDKFCLGSEISFDNLTTPKQIVKDYLWDFGDGNYSSQFEPSHTYAGPGVYEVTLTAISWCGCESTYSMFITVTRNEAPVIWCPGLVTDQNKHSYTVDDPCERGVWTTDGGTIIGPNNGSSVNVVWNNVNPSDGFGYLHYHSACGCTTTVKIPVVLEEAEITGDDVICVGEQKIYSLPQWATTQFSWSISQGSFTHTDQPNEVAIDGLAPGTYTLSCIYTNSIWGYSGTAEKEITVLEKPEIVAEDIKFCSGEEEHTYTTVSGNPVCWKLLKDGVSVLEGGSYYGEELDYTFTEGGLYILTASNNENCEGSTGCVSDPVIIKVIQNPPAPEGEIEGSKYVCEGIIYQYSYENTVPGTMLVWEAAGGAVIQGSDIGETVSVKFTGSGPYYISVKRQTTDEPVCVSEGLTLTVEKLNIDLTIISDNGFTFCPSSTEEFTADFGEGLEDFEPDYIEWQVYNSVGEFNFGSIIEGGNTPDVVVSWNNITNNESTGWIRLRVIHCGVEYTETVPITLHQPPAIAILSSDNICPGDETIDIELDLGGVTEGTVSFWFEGNPVPVEQDVQEDGTQNLDGSYTFTVLNNFNNTNATSVNQTLTVSLKYCYYTVSATKNFAIYPETKITITPNSDVIICSNVVSYSHVLYSDLVVGDNASAEFMWYKGGTPLTGWLPGTLGLAATSYTISGTVPQAAAGEYYVVVKDEYGCIVKSNKIKVIVDDCGPQQVECEPYASEITLTSEWHCENFVVTVNYNDEPEGYEWYALSGGIFLTDGQNTENATFTTDKPGKYFVAVKLIYPECELTKHIEVTKFYEPKLLIGAVCGTNNTYDVTLHNTSMIISGGGTLEYRYYTGSTVNPSNLIATTNGGSHTIQGVTTTGLHTYTLAIVSSNTNLPVCSVTETIYLDPHTPPAFTISGSEFCAKDAIELTITNHVPGYTYTWEFYNTSYTTLEEVTRISIEDADDYDITLTAQTPYGCTLVSDEEKVDVYKAEFAGTFNYTEEGIDICVTDTAPAIAFVHELGSPIPSGYIWMKGSEPVPGETGATFVPTETGVYWAVLVDENGCKDDSMASEAVNVNIRPLPVINITGNTFLCYGESTTIKGVAGSGVEHKWQLGGVDMGGDYGEWSDDPDLLKIEVENTGSLAPGTYEYTLWVRYADMPGCAGSKTFTLNVYDQLTEPQLGYVVELCEPYTVRIYVTNVQTTGHYEWANGDTESYTFVYAGGIYRVTYIDAESGCRITSDIQVPDSPEQSMWFFPSGCFDICPWGDPQPYIMGLDGMFDYHQWLVNGIVAHFDTHDAISSIDIDQPGTYQLSVTQEKPGPDCIYESGIAYISPSMATLAECEVPQCNGLVHALNPPSVPHPSGKYYIYGNIGNNYPVPVTVTISSFNGYGTYTPGTITIPAYGNHSFNPSPLVFTPNPGFNGGDDYIVISIPDMPCVRLFPRSFPVNPYLNPEPDPAKMMPKDTADAFLRVTPNPAGAMAAVSYGLGTEYQKAESLKIYTMLGTLVAEINLHTNNDDLPLDISRFPSGTYIITLQADGNTVLHQKLIKK